MVRLDKFLCDCNMGTRSQVKEYIRKGQVTVNGMVVKKPESKIDEGRDKVTAGGKVCGYRKFAYYMLNKPAGVVSATVDNTADTVLSLLEGVADKKMFPVGRLDKDTEGLLLITNDGDLAHRLLSPGKHVDKTYLVTVRVPLQEEDIHRLKNGVDIGEEKLTLPAKVRVLDEGHILLTIHEGRFHQVKRMLHSVGNEVMALKRMTFGPLELDENLAPGQFRALTEEEVSLLGQKLSVM